MGGSFVVDLLRLIKKRFRWSCQNSLFAKTRKKNHPSDIDYESSSCLQKLIYNHAATDAQKLSRAHI